MGDQRKEKAKVGRLKGDIGWFSGDLRGHKVPSEEAMGGARGPLEGPRAVQEPTRSIPMIGVTSFGPRAPWWRIKGVLIITILTSLRRKI